jgi:hypothetical protein
MEVCDDNGNLPCGSNAMNGVRRGNGRSVTFPVASREMPAPQPSNEQTISRRHLAVFATVAIAILALGTLLRDRLIQQDAPKTTPPSEAFALQRLSQENQLRDIATYLSERVKSVAPFVVRQRSLGITGIRWGSGDSVLTTTREHPVSLVLPLLPDTLRPPVAPSSDSLGMDWLLLVGRDGANRIISEHGISGGTALSACASRPVVKYILGLSIAPEFAGAGIFDLSGQLRGMVIACGESFAPVPSEEIPRLLRDTVSFITVPAELDSSTTQLPASPKRSLQKR